MSLPTAPTIAAVVTEAYQRTGVQEPSSDQLYRGEYVWLEEVKRDIASRKDWRLLEHVVAVITQAGVARYQLPAPLHGVHALIAYDGAIRGTLAGGTLTTVTLGIGSTATPAQLIGRMIFLTDGTAAGQANRIRAYDSVTTIATMEAPWAQQPGASTTYLIANYECDLVGPIPGLHAHGERQGFPRRWSEWDQQIVLDPIPDRSDYGMEWQGTMDVTLLDKDSAKHARLLREWWTPLVYGLMIKKLEDDDDVSGVNIYTGKYEAAIVHLMKQDSRRARRTGGTPLAGVRGMPGRVR